MDRHFFDADPDPNFHVYADPATWHQNEVDQNAEPTPFQFLHMLENKEKLVIFIHSNTISQCFSFLINGKSVTILSIFFT